MVIHVFIAHMGLGGAERVCVSLANEWAKMGHEVHIAVLNLEDDINTSRLDDSVSVHSFGVSRIRYAFLPFFKYIKKYRPPFFLIFGNDSAIVVQKLREFHLIDTPLIVRVLNNVNISLSKEDGVSKIVENYLKKAQSNLRKMDHLVAQCKTMGDQLIDMGFADKDRLSIILNPVDGGLIKKVEALNDFGNKGETKERKEITFIGRIDPQKNPLDLIEVFAKVREKRDVTLRLVGRGVLKDAVIEKADRLHVAEHVIYDDIRTDMENVYSGSDVVVLTSDYEGMPNCLIEAIGCGVPVVSYDCPMGPSEIVQEDVNGFLIPMGDTERMADRIICALDREWDKDAIRHSCDKFRVEQIADRYIEIFDKVKR